MGQKVNPIILRLGNTKPDISTWSDFSGKSAELVLQDLQLRDFLANLLKSRGILLRHCFIARSNQKIELDLDLYFSYIFSKQAKFLWARSLFQNIKKKYTKIHKIKDIRTLSSTLKAFRYIQGSDKKFKHKIKFSQKQRLKHKKRKRLFLLTSSKGEKLYRNSNLLFFFFLKNSKKIKILPKKDSVSLSFLLNEKLEKEQTYNCFRYKPSKLTDLFLLNKVRLRYKKASFRASAPIYHSQKYSNTLLDLSKRLCRSLQKFTGLEKITLKLSSQQLFFLPMLKLYRQIILKELLFFQKNKELSKFFFEVIECTYFIFSTFGFGNAALLSSFIKAFLESSRKQLLFVKFLQKILSIFFTSLPSKIRAIEGIKVSIKGRFNKRRRTKTYVIQEGQISLQTINLPVDYCQTHAVTLCGSFGIKVWISKRNPFKT
jgi:hypothetical protein